jgi:hypothetical protein
MIIEIMAMNLETANPSRTKFDIQSYDPVVSSEHLDVWGIHWVSQPTTGIIIPSMKSIKSSLWLMLSGYPSQCQTIMIMFDNI